MQRLIFILLIAFVGCAAQTPKHDRLLIAVTRNYAIPKTSESVSIVIEWRELSRRLPSLRTSFTIIDQNFGRAVTPRLVDTNHDKNPDYVVLDYTFESNEPVFAFLLSVSDEKRALVSGEVKQDTRLTVRFLNPYREEASGQQETIAARLVQSTINQYPDLKDFPIYAPDRWNYEYSFFLAGAYRLGRETGQAAYVDLARRWLDRFTGDQGFRDGVYDMSEYKLDDVIPARLAIWFYQETGNPSYRKIADTIALQLRKQPATSAGGYWHKQIYPHQMWLDGVFMADVFAMQYAQAFQQPQWFDKAVHQIHLIYRYTRDPVTGLLYHGWDESKNKVWAHPDKGTSPEFWGRAVGWYMMALVDCLEYLPVDHPSRGRVITILQELSASVLRYQDASSKLWYQVMDKGSQSGNWIEASCSAMFAYAFAKGSRLGYLDQPYRDAATQAFDALLRGYVYTDDAGNLHLDRTVKIGTLNPKTSKGDFAYYISTECRLDDYKGLGALLHAAIELKR